MGVLTPFRRRWQARNAEAIQARQDQAVEPSGSRFHQHIAAISAAGLVFASMGFGGLFAWQSSIAHGVPMAVLTVLFAVALEASKPLAVSSAFTAFRNWAVPRGLALSLLAAVAIAYSLTAELTLLAGSRGDLVAKREAAIETHADKREAVKAARAELATLPPSRTIEEAKADITKLLAANPKAGECRHPAAHATARYICPKVVVLNGEMARAKRRAELQATIAKATDGPATGTAVHAKVADPGSAALATYLGSLGFEVSATTLTDWLVLIPVLALEIGAALSAVLVQSVGGGQRPVPSTRTQATPLAGKSMDRQTPAPAGERPRSREARPWT